MHEATNLFVIFNKQSNKLSASNSRIQFRSCMAHSSNGPTSELTMQHNVENCGGHIGASSPGNRCRPPNLPKLLATPHIHTGKRPRSFNEVFELRTVSS